MNQQKEVYFAEWCKKCKHYKADEEHLNPDHPCWECLDTPVNTDSHKPIRFEQADEPKKGKIKVESYTVSEK